MKSLLERKKPQSLKLIGSRFPSHIFRSLPCDSVTALPRNHFQRASSPQKSNVGATATAFRGRSGARSPAALSGPGQPRTGPAHGSAQSRAQGPGSALSRTWLRTERTERTEPRSAAAPAAPRPSRHSGSGAPRLRPPRKAEHLPEQSRPRCPSRVPSLYGKRPRALKTKLRWSQRLHPAEHERVCIHSYPAGPGLDLCAHYVSGQLSSGPERKIRPCCRIYNSFSILYFVC